MRSFENKHVKDIETFLKKKKKKSTSIIVNVTNLSEKQKQKQVEYMRNYYLTDKK